MSTNKIFVDKLGNRDADAYIGKKGELFYDATYGGLRLGDGLHAGGTPIGLEVVAETVDAAYENYLQSLASWDSVVEYGQQADRDNLGVSEQGWPWINWKVNGENVLAYRDELTRIWTIQNVPSSPPTPLAWSPAISASFYNELRAVLTYIAGAYAAYQTALASKKISGDELTVPDILQNTPDENFVLRLRTSLVTSPPGGIDYSEKDWEFKVNGTLGFPDGNTQTGAAISIAELKAMAVASTDFAAFKAAILAY